jgi:hypothetical protein
MDFHPAGPTVMIIEDHPEIRGGFRCELRGSEFGTVEIHADHGQQSVQGRQYPVK